MSSRSSCAGAAALIDAIELAPAAGGWTSKLRQAFILCCQWATASLFLIGAVNSERVGEDLFWPTVRHAALLWRSRSLLLLVLQLIVADFSVLHIAIG